MENDLLDAKRRAKQMYEERLKMEVGSKSAMVPATRMYELVDELERYM